MWCIFPSGHQQVAGGREDGAIESSQHWLSCEAYVELRAGLDPEYDLDDRVVFLRRVQIHRTTLEKELV